MPVKFLFSKSIYDEKFGLLKFSKLTKDAWKGKTKFIPTDDEISIYITDLEEHISSAHKAFYQELELKYPTFVDKIADLLHKEYIAAGGDLEHQNIWNKFQLSGISFPSVNQLLIGSFKWDMFYSYAPQTDAFLVEMKEWLPVACYAGESPIS